MQAMEVLAGMLLRVRESQPSQCRLHGGYNFFDRPRGIEKNQYPSGKNIRGDLPDSCFGYQCRLHPESDRLAAVQTVDFQPRAALNCRMNNTHPLRQLSL